MSFIKGEPKKMPDEKKLETPDDEIPPEPSREGLIEIPENDDDMEEESSEDPDED
jgi:hypothetical protein